MTFEFSFVIYFIHSNLFLLSASCILLIKHVHKLQQSATDAVHFVRLTTVNFVCSTLFQLFGTKPRVYVMTILIRSSMKITIFEIIFIFNYKHPYFFYPEILILKTRIIFAEETQFKISFWKNVLYHH